MSQLEQLTTAERALAEAETVGEVKAIYDIAEAYRVYATNAEEQNKAAIVKLRAAAKGGRLLAAAPKRRRHVNSESLSELLGVESDDAAAFISSQWQKVAKREDAGVLDEYIAAAPDEVTMAGLLRDGAHVGQNSGEPEWYTPADIIDAARDVLGGIDLDPASSDIANETVQAERFYTVEDNGLAQPWFGRVWMNPPYTVRVIDQFIARMIDEHRAGNVTAAIVLTNNSTDTGWWQSLARCSDGICLKEGRVRFLSPEGEQGTPLQGQAIAYLGPDRSAFIERFNEFGVVL